MYLLYLIGASHTSLSRNNAGGALQAPFQAESSWIVLMQNGSRVGADANPISVLEQPGVDKALVAGIRFPAFHALYMHHSVAIATVAIYMDAERFRRDLLLLRCWLRRG